MPTPSQLRKTATSVQEQKRIAADKEAKKAARELKARIKKIQEGKFDEYVKFVDGQIAEDAADGRLRSKIELATFGDYDYPRSERAIALKPIWSDVADYYKTLGFSARVSVDNETEYYSDGADTGPITHIYIYVSWEEK